MCSWSGYCCGLWKSKEIGCDFANIKDQFSSWNKNYYWGYYIAKQISSIVFKPNAFPVNYHPSRIWFTKYQFSVLYMSEFFTLLGQMNTFPWDLHSPVHDHMQLPILCTLTWVVLTRALKKVVLGDESYSWGFFAWCSSLYALLKSVY